MPIAKLGAMAFMKETTYGTIPTGFSTSAIIHPIFEERVTSENTMENVELIAGSLEYDKFYTGDFTAGGDIVFPIHYGLSGNLFYAFFGTDTKTAEGDGYKHVFTFNSTIPSYYFWIDRVTEQFGYSGGVMNTMSVSIQRRETPVRLSTNWIFTKEEIYSGTDPTISIPTEKMFIRKNATFKIGGTENNYCKGITIDLNRNIDVDSAKTLKSGRFLAEPVTGSPTATGTITFRFSSMTEWKYFWGASDASAPQDEITGVALEISVQGDLISTGVYNKLTFSIPNAVLTRRTDGTLQGAGGIDVSYNWEAHYDTSTSCKFKVELINTTSTQYGT